MKCGEVRCECECERTVVGVAYASVSRASKSRRRGYGGVGATKRLAERGKGVGGRLVCVGGGWVLVRAKYCE